MMHQHDHFVCLYLKTWRVSFYRSHRRFRLNFRILSIPVLYNFSRFCRKFLGEYFSPKVWRPYKLVLLISCLQIVICLICGPFLFTTTLKNVSIYIRQPWFSLTTHFHQNGRLSSIVVKDSGYTFILLSQYEHGISALDLQKHFSVYLLRVRFHRCNVMT
jgi:hypothetical protein